ncbi:histidine kinase [Flavobacterium sp. NRK F10]|uniref:sensor histidine kinase n=1 Tax=Flavobacterium sp. NRK F10 TaxID=2954931 RepID=UPI0020906F91|nr:histidine kinase [Flavobacterium sp. NRK F10]MCO6175921.1 histidine kinase [Flavobacterium sp. NRK F10]
MYKKRIALIIEANFVVCKTNIMCKNLEEKKRREDQLIQFLTNKKYRLKRHAVMITLFILAIFNTTPEYTEPTETISRIIAIVLFLVLIYINMYFLVPKLLFENHYKRYGLCVIGLIIISNITNYIGQYIYTIDVRLEPEKEHINFLPFSLVIFIIISASAAIKLFQQWMLDTQIINELERSKALVELDQLKNQINPHFLFNMLNNANVLTKKDPEKASQVLMRLSDLLRYQLYDSSRDNVLLTSDIRFLEDFLNLEKVRRDNFSFLISKEGDLNGVQVPPLLFISFVENAVKHNNDSSNSSFINLYFNIENNILIFKCENSVPSVKAIQKTGGIGLANIKRRLELLFPITHHLDIDENNGLFCVTLTIKL